MKQNNKKQVYLAPAVEANVVSVEAGFQCSGVYCGAAQVGIIENFVEGSAILM